MSACLRWGLYPLRIKGDWYLSTFKLLTYLNLTVGIDEVFVPCLLPLKNWKQHYTHWQKQNTETKGGISGQDRLQVSPHREHNGINL